MSFEADLRSRDRFHRLVRGCPGARKAEKVWTRELARLAGCWGGARPRPWLRACSRRAIGQHERRPCVPRARRTELNFLPPETYLWVIPHGPLFLKTKQLRRPGKVMFVRSPQDVMFEVQRFVARHGEKVTAKAWGLNPLTVARLAAGFGVQSASLRVAMEGLKMTDAEMQRVAEAS